MFSRSAWARTGLALLACSLPTWPVAAQDDTGSELGDGMDSRSVGRAEEGRLENAFPLEPGDHLAVVRPHRYGTRELVGLLYRAAAHVARAAPGAQLSVGDLSAEQGGHLNPHGSHQSGRDVDVGFYVLDESGRPVERAMFMDIDTDGWGRRGSHRYRFDTARNWQLMVALVDDPIAGVQHVLIAAHLRDRLMAQGQEDGATGELMEKVRLVTAPISGSERHDDHFHVRIYCSVGDRPDCLDVPPLHPWYDGTPSPRAIRAARVADARRATALRREQDSQRRIAEAIRRAEQAQLAAERDRAADLAHEPRRQAAAERSRVAQLSRLRRALALGEQRRDALLRREVRLQQAQERQREARQRAQLETERRRARLQEAAERRRLASVQLRAERQLAAELRARRQTEGREERRRQAAARRDLQAIQRRAEQQLAAEHRRAEQFE